MALSFSANAQHPTETKSANQVPVMLASPKVFGINDVQTAEKNKVVDFTFTEDGKKIKFSELTKGKVVFLNFWGTWCPPCRRELPDIVEIAKELKDKDIVVCGVALERDASTAVKTVTDFAAKNGIIYRLFIGNAELQTAYGGISAVPTTFIIDKNGNIVETIVGMRDKEAFMKSIKKVL